MTDRARACDGFAISNRSALPRPSASGAEAAARKNERRLTPAQVRAGKLPMSNM
jgi:hypothetical protein